ncbi:MAG: hypothetical protein HYZ88_01525 [Candidatus Omnitrophica bacterium]|nr:hypothetical protein [Candidatus Omnitrophota bacterium]
MGGAEVTTEEWRKRQAQWKQFHEWEAAHHAVTLSPSERLAEIGALVDLAYRAGRANAERADAKALVSGVRVMRERLAVLHRPA